MPKRSERVTASIYLVDGEQYTAQGVCDAAAEYGYSGDDPESATRLLQVWGYKVVALEGD